MKSFQKLLATICFVAIAMFVFVSCSKKDDNVLPAAKPSVNAIAGAFNVQDGDVQILKSAPIGVTRTWTMQARNSVFYGNAAFANVNGSEFITGSAAYNWWHVAANNPVTFPAAQAVYSNLTPDEDLRLITETKDAAGNVAYLGMLDFNPGSANFPLTLHGFRLGDELAINTYALTKLPGGNALTITVNYGLAPIDLAATKSKPTLTGNAGIPNGTEFSWSDIVYGTSVFADFIVPASSSDVFVPVYVGLNKKVMGTITITITEAGGTAIVLTVLAKGAGKGLNIKLTTTKVGWFDSGTINFHDGDISYETEVKPVN